MKKKSISFSGSFINGSAMVVKMFCVLVLMSAISASFGQTTTTVLNPTSPWIVPANAVSITVECWGGGGGGGGANDPGITGGAAGGGGGGAYSLQIFSVSAGQSYIITKGAGGTAGSNSGSNGGVGGTTTVTGPGGTCSAAGGGGGTGATSSGVKASGTGGASGAGFLYSGGNGSVGFLNSTNSNGAAGGGGAGNAGNGNNGLNAAAGVTAVGGTGGIGNPNAAPFIGGNGGNGSKQGSPWYGNGNPGSVPGGGGGGAGSYDSGGSGGKGSGGAGAAGQVYITVYYHIVSTEWLNQYCPTAPTGSYIDGGTISPSRALQSINTVTNTGSYGYVYWTFNASADSTYYFDLCSSTGTTGTTWLRLHNARHTSPSNNYCMDASNTPTLVTQNIANGCAGTGNGLSKLIWTCRTSGTYYLESAVGTNPAFWGVQSNQTAVLNYKTLPSSSITCSEVFYDKGIDGTDGISSGYNNNEDWIYTYYPTDTVTEAINIQFTSFSTAPGDILCVYNGNSVNAPVIGCYSGPSITGAFSSSANDGSLTFRFTSDDSLISTGWAANVTCIPSLKVDNDTRSNPFGLFPNPVKDQLEISGLKMDDNTTFQIVDVFGKDVSKQHLPRQQGISASPSSTMIDVSELPAGIYFISIKNKTEVRIGKFVKQ